VNILPIAHMTTKEDSELHLDNMSDELQRPQSESTIVSANLHQSERQSMSNTPFPHQEHHRENGPVLRDAIIGFADGLTVPFALTAGLSS
jgi:hypothetical protein